MDYSPFYFKYDRKSSSPEPLKDKDFSFNTCANPKPKRDYFSVVLVLLIILPVIAVLIFADVRTGGHIGTAVKRLVSGDKYVFYMVVRGPYDTERDANAHATVTRQAGGAGYIYTEEGKYYVALATYLSKKEAKSVMDKNDGSTITELKLKAGELYGGTYGKLYKRSIEFAYESIENLTDACSGLDAHSLSTDEALKICSEIRDEAYDIKSEILDLPSGADKERLLSVIDPLFGGTEAVTTLSDESTLVPAMRYIACSTVHKTQKIG